MRTIERTAGSILKCAALFLAALLLRGLVPKAMADAGTNGDFSALGKSVVTLLQSHDAARFAAEVAPTIEDWQSTLFTNATDQNPNPIAGFRQSAEYQRTKIEQGAKQLLAKIDSLHVDFSKRGLRAQVITPQPLGTIQYSAAVALPWTDKAEIVLIPETGTNNPAGGKFKLMLRSLMRFPGGWRCQEGIQWVSFPSGVADAKTLREMAILVKAATYQSITGEDDPALLKLGDALVHFIRERDTGIFTNEAYVTANLLWSIYQQSGQQGPSRQELDDQLKEQARQQMGIAGATIQLMENAGIDLKKADIQIKGAMVERIQSSGVSGSVMGLRGDGFKLFLVVKSGGKSKNGTSLSGDYILDAATIMRFADDWKVFDNVHWYRLPAGIVDTNTIAKIDFENYVAEHRTLPPKTTVPEIEFTALDGEKKMKLSDLRGKVVVLDFWATWCGACQEPLAKLQTVRRAHPGWGDKVAIVPLSIDDTLKLARDHVDKRGWTNTFNVWGGEGGWQCKAATGFRVHGVPTTYVIDGQGKIVNAQLGGLDIEKEVDKLLGLATSEIHRNP